MYEQLEDGSEKKAEILKEITEKLNHRLHLDSSIDFIGKLIFGALNGPTILKNIRPSGQPLVDDWDCLKAMVRVFETHCGSLTLYGMKHMRAFANICNSGISIESMEGACIISACGGYNSAKWSPLSHGFSVDHRNCMRFDGERYVINFCVRSCLLKASSFNRSCLWSS
ncbi:hypothetical protein HPP92_025595 [Vanilla planifolia]|uniref:Legumain prodomain domain-containing protein n=1 Tax=Vanilla planifolia TaxID=51239 RepID=A0A835PFN6_VANPL|nr:hypothetical protein HPP92_025595 [Vanilla planifolia]